MERYTKTTALDKISKLTKRIRFVNGGTGASKTISILMWLIDYCQTHNNKVVSVVSETLPHLRKGAVRDFLNIMTAHNYFQDSKWNKSEFTYNFGTTILEFFSADQSGKVRGPRRDVLYLNEGNNVPYDVFVQLEIRTKDIIWIDSNPTHEYWIYTDVIPHQDIDHITLTYKDNEGLPESVIQSIESKKHNKNFWLVYGLGQLGELEGKIFSGWQIIDEISHEARLERRGLDYGYSIDPSGLLDVYYFNGGYILDEQLYQTGMSNKRIADFILDLDHPETLVIADSAEPKSIDEMYGYGVNIRGAEKGKDSVRQGIQFMQDLPISVTKRSINLIKEYRNYTWATDRMGNTITPNVPEDAWDHLLSAARYALSTLERRDPAKEQAKLKNYIYQRQERQKATRGQYGL